MARGADGRLHQAAPMGPWSADVRIRCLPSVEGRARARVLADALPAHMCPCGEQRPGRGGRRGHARAPAGRVWTRAWLESPSPGGGQRSPRGPPLDPVQQDRAEPASGRACGPHPRLLCLRVGAPLAGRTESTSPGERDRGERGPAASGQPQTLSLTPIAASLVADFARGCEIGAPSRSCCLSAA